MFDTGGIYFVIENSDTCIICNDCTQFVVNLEVQSCQVENSVGVGTYQYVGTIRIILTDYSGEYNSNDISGAIYYPNSLFNIIVIPYLGDLFRGYDSIPNSDDDGKKIISSTNKSHFTWDHFKHKRNFTHSAIRFPELALETRFGYFSSFCTRVQRFYHDHVDYAFSSVYTILPDKLD